LEWWRVSEAVVDAKAHLFRVLGHPVRVRVLELLGAGDLAGPALAAAVPVAAGVLAQQLAVLQAAGLVRQLGAGGDVRYVLVEPALTGVLAAAGVVGSVAANAPVDVRRAVQPALFAEAPPEVLV
jgi:ArsR family transcriptional regulator